MIRFRKAKSRKGTAVVELAICLPIIAVVVFASIEASSLVFLRQTLVQASYESVKVAVDPEATNANANAAAFQVTDGRNLEGVTVTLQPGNVQNVPRGATITVTVSAPGNSNSLFPFQMFNNRTISASATMVKE
jgi:Flp pilus assembly protein TadG